jgi:hypothetical protein
MFRALGPGIGGLIVMALWIFAIFDVIATDEILVRNLPKGLWLVLVIFVPVVGPLAWLIMGRPMYAGWQPGGQRAPESKRQAPRGIEDDPGWSGTNAAPQRSADELRRWERDLARREEELRRRDDGPGPAE